MTVGVYIGSIDVFGSKRSFGFTSFNGVGVHSLLFGMEGSDGLHEISTLT